MTIKYCSSCGTARQRNIVNHKPITGTIDNYTCLECLLFPVGINKKDGGRYYKAVYREVKSSLNVARCALCEVCIGKDKAGYYIVDDVALDDLRELVKSSLSRCSGLLP